MTDGATRGKGPEQPEILIELPVQKESVSTARNALQTVCGRVPDQTFEDLKLLVSELITNSIRHTGLGSKDLIELRVLRQPGLIRAEVSDPGPGFKQEPPRPFSERESGWGLFLVENISDRWGMSVNQETRVWFELDIAGENKQDGALRRVEEDQASFRRHKGSSI